MNRLSRTADRLRLRHPGGPDPNVERHASWHELFFDLVFVLTLLGVTARLDTRPSPSPAQLAAAVGLDRLLPNGDPVLERIIDLCRLSVREGVPIVFQ